MKTIAATVVDYIKTKPYLSSALSDGIINLTSLARNIQDDIEELTKKPVKPGAIVMALKRISDTADFVQTKQITMVLKNLGDITVRSSLVDYSFLISDSLLVAQSNLLNEIEQKKEVFYTSSRGVSESNIIVSQNIAPLVDELFKDESCFSKTENLSSIYETAVRKRDYTGDLLLYFPTLVLGGSQYQRGDFYFQRIYYTDARRSGKYCF